MTCECNVKNVSLVFGRGSIKTKSDLKVLFRNFRHTSWLYHFFYIVDGTLNRKKLLEWYKKSLQPFSDVISVTDLTSSWRNGMALLALVQLFRPEVA